MGFLDKAKQMAEQAQTKLDEVQRQFNENQPHPPGPGSQAPVEYDAQGRPIRSDQPAVPTPPPGDPVAGRPSPPPPAPAAEPTPDPAAPAAPAPGPRDAGEEDRNHPSYAPPKLTSGDPLAG